MSAAAARLRGPAAYLGSLVLHGLLFLGVASVRPTPPQRATAVEVEIVETARPPPAPPPPEPERAPEPAPLPAPRPPRVARLTPPVPRDAPPPRPAPDDAPPPPNAPPPSGEPAKPGPVRIGVSMSSTTTAGSYAAPVGNSVYGQAPRQAEDPSSAQPYAAERYLPPTQVTALPEVVRCELPREEYPAAARKQEREAEVKLRLVIDAEGRVREARALGDPGLGFAEAAVASVKRHCRFRPARKDGAAVATEITYTVRYELD